MSQSKTVDDAPPRRALDHLRVLDLTTQGAAYAGKLLADLGADVVKIEPPGGDPGRSEAPQRASASGMISLPFLYENARKKCLVLDLAKERDRETFRGWVKEADLVLESFPVDTLASWGLDYVSLQKIAPGIVLTSMTGFGQTGPDRAHRSNDLIASAMGGAMTSIGNPSDPPVRLAGHQADVITGSTAAGSSLIALAARDRTGLGQHVDISSLEVMAAITHIAGVGKWLEDGVIPKRVGTGLVASVPSGAYPCKDGLVYLMVNRPAHWLALAEWIHEVTGNEEVLQSEFHGPSSNRLPYRELLDLFIGELTATLTVDEAYHEGQRRHIAFTPVHTAARIMADPQLEARDFFHEVDLGGADSLRFPNEPYRFSASARPEPARTRPLEAAAATDSVWRTDSWVREVPKTDSAAAEKGALAGMRFVEFGTGLAAPWIGRILAWAGAEVIKVESQSFPDVPRLFVSPREPERGTQPECSPWFTDWSAGKRFVSLDLRTEEGAEIARRLVDESDAVIANYSTGVLEKLGVGYEVLANRPSRRKGELVMLESSGFGARGPLANYVTWGPNIEALSGLCSFSGFPENECTISHFAYPDPLSALHGLVALMAALANRARRGQGQVIHLSQFETTVASIGRLIAEFAATGVEPERRGNREVGLAPYGCFPCVGDDRWIVLCVESDEDWEKLREVMGNPAWSRESRFEEMASRVANADALEEKIAEWTSAFEDRTLLHRLREAGLAAGIVQNTDDMFNHDAQLRFREFFEEIPHFKRGRVTATGIPMGLTGTPGRTLHAGSSIGHDNLYVFEEILGLSQEEIDGFIARGAIEDPT